MVNYVIIAKSLPKMKKKNFARRARVVEGARWYIDFVTTSLQTGNETRSRKDFGLNDITDLQVRREVATRIAIALETFIIEAGSIQPEVKAKKEFNLLASLQAAAEVKYASPRKQSHKNYRVGVDWLSKYLAAVNRKGMNVSEFEKRDAKAFVVWIKKQKEFTGRTINNYTSALKTLWNEMKDQETAEINPWTEVKLLKVSEKIRRVLTEKERTVIADTLEKEHYWMFRVVLLVYYCHIRPVELTRLRFRDFDTERGLIHIGEAQSKTWKKRTVTIPSVILKYFADGIFNKKPGNYYWLGGGWEPNSTEPLNVKRLFRKHYDVTRALQKVGKLEDVTGITLYGWKDTGISVHARHTSLRAAQDQAGHTTMDQTMVYYHAPLVNEEYRDLPDTIHEK